ncbi:exodeoxyribonuclease III [Corynebacterium auriscanis]|uniref:exodeoxyribonuclease III n=1 Tax=Corynebacterium auriscanis TaxID=99807 RepID=UPI003CF051A3
MTLTVATVNVNGIRAAAKQRSETNLGILPWLENTSADVVLMQEVRANEKQTEAALAPALEAGWHLVQAEAAAKGRAGVGILSRLPLTHVATGFAHAEEQAGLTASPGAREFDDSGRYIEARVNTHFGPVTVASLYLPSGAANSEKQDEKYRFLDSFGHFMQQRAACTVDGEPENMIIGGDWNICHRRADLKNWRTNRTKSGFLPDERAFMDSILGSWPDESTQVGDGTDAGRTGNPAGRAGDFYGAVDYSPTPLAQQRLREGASENPQWFDVVRRLNPEADGPYSWWTYRGQAFDTDAGWRLDLHVATEGMLERARVANNAWVDRAEAYDLRWSDHSPVIVEYA